jgi:hypothetical protein
MEIESLMKIDQENGIQTRKYALCAARVIDRDQIDHNLDLLRARVWERSIWAARMQRTQEIVVTVMAIMLGSVMGWLLVR